MLKLKPIKKMKLKQPHLSSVTVINISIFIISFLFTSLLFSQEKVSFEKAFSMLKEGNQRFVKGTVAHPNLTQEVRLAIIEHGQHPYVTIIGCSDSQDPFEAIFDAGIGNLFVISVARNVVDTDKSESIEYGIGYLHTPLMVVLDHTNCCAVTEVT